MAAEAVATLADVIHERYGPDEEIAGEEEGIGGGGVVFFSAPTNPLQSLRIAVLRDCNIRTVGDIERFEQCRRLMELDLTGNVLGSWEEVDKLLCALPSLRSLNLSQNSPLLDSEVPESSHEGEQKARLRTLVLNGLEFRSEAQLQAVLTQYAPHCHEISLGSCGLSSLPVEGWPETLRTLRLERNRISDWEALWRPLHLLPHLQHLILSENPLEEVGDPLPSLRQLNLSSTAIASWETVRRVGEFPALRELWIRSVPLVEGLEDDIARMLLIASLPNVSAGGEGLQTVGSETAGKLNGGPITRGERREAEVFAERYQSGAWAQFREGLGRQANEGGTGAAGTGESAAGADRARALGRIG